MSSQEVKRLLEALQNEENKILEKIKKSKIQGGKNKIEKDW